MGDLAKLVEALSAAAWPVIILYVIWRYRQGFADLITSAKNREFTVEFGGQKLSMKEASAEQRGLLEDLQKQLNEIREKVEGSKIPAAAAAAELVKDRLMPIVSNAVLWADDHPKNNSFFIDLLQKRGYRVDLAISTQDALSLLDRNKYLLIISDMSRDEAGKDNQDAGVDLLEEVKKRRIDSPYVVFCSDRGARRFGEQIRQLGGQAITSSPTELRAILDELAPEAGG
jgi:CheY-like chemotaxis protein